MGWVGRKDGKPQLRLRLRLGSTSVLLLRVTDEKKRKKQNVMQNRSVFSSRRDKRGAEAGGGNPQ